MQNLSDDDCDENEKFELPKIKKITKLPSFTEYQKRSQQEYQKRFQQEKLPTEKV